MRLKILVFSCSVLLLQFANAFADIGTAQNPDPANGATNVSINKILNFSAGSGAVSHDIYFGTDANAVSNAQRLVGDLNGDGKVDFADVAILVNYWTDNPDGSEPYAGVDDDNIVDFYDFALMAENWQNQSSPCFKGNTTATTYTPDSNLALNTTYYWRVDEVNSSQTQKGDVWSFTTAISTNSDYNLVGKIMCGYQGWFNCPGDGTDRGWIHWSSSTSSFTPSNRHIDMWPDMNEMTAGEKFLASSFYDGNNYYVFSSHNHSTVLRHFQWMQQYGIDGIFLQRFAKEVKDQGSDSFLDRNDLLDYCKDGANTYGRVYAVMYDLSGLKAGETSYVINDWKYLVNTKKVGRDPNDHSYVFHKGKPVVAVWGIGFNDGRKYTLTECLNLVNFLKNDPNYGNCTVMVGVPSYWRTLDNTKDCLPDPNLWTIIRAADIVSPWSVGRYDASGVSTFGNNVWVPDVAWCEGNNVEYMPVIWPGYSYHNAGGSSYPLNQYPRNGGQFFWSQLSTCYTAAGARMIYVAMFDEADEGTAIFKVSNNPPAPGGAQMFITYNMDGYTLPSDEYLWLTGQAGAGLRGEITISRSRPAR